MNYIIYKADGSVLVQNMEFYIQQGNSGDKIFVGFEGALATDTATAFFTLPNKQTNTLGGVNTTKTVKVEGVDTTFRGFEFTLTTDQTTYNGYLRMAVVVFRDDALLVSYPLALIINETGVRPDADSGVTIEELNGYLAQIQSLSKDNVRTYNLTDFTTFADIIADIGLNQFFACSFDYDISLCIIYTDGSTYSMLINNPYGVYVIDSVAESQVVKSATIESIFLTDNQVLLDSPSGTLTSSQLDQISKNNCYIFFADRKFTFAYRDTLNNVAYFRCLRHINNYHGSEDYIEFDVETITVNTSTGAYGYSYGGTNFYYYNKTQADNKFEIKANKVTSVSNTSTDTQYPSAKCLYDNVQNVREVAEGKCQTFVLSYSDTAIASPNSFYDIEGNLHPYSDFSDFVSGYSAGNSLFNSQNDSINPIGNIAGYLGTKYYFIFKSISGSTWLLSGGLIVVKSDELFNVAKTGDIFLVVETDVPDRWFGSTNASTGTAYKLETAKVDLTDYPTKSGNETISGNWTFSSYISFNTGGSGETTWSIRKGSNQLEIYNGTTQTYVWQGSAFFSMVEGDLGTSSRKWGNLFLKQDGRIKVNGDNDALRFYQGLTYFYGDFKPIGNDQNLGDSTHKVNNAWVNTLKGIVTLTQAQYDALVSGGTVDADTLYFIEEE